VNVPQRSCLVAALVAAMLVPGSRLFAGPSLHARPLPEGRSFFSDVGDLGGYAQQAGAERHRDPAPQP
jgi:hypothetical protein